MARQGGLSADDIAALDELSARLSVGDYYALLGVARDAPRSEIRAAFFALSKRFHPDRFFRVELGARQSQVEQVFSALSRAYETLSRSAVRRMYDAELGEDELDERSTDRVPAEAAGGEASTARPVPAPTVPEPSSRRRKPAGPSQHVLQQLASRVRAREAETAARRQSVVPPAPSGRSAATALARELMPHASRDELRLRGYLRSADAAEQEERWSDAYRYLSLAQRISPDEIPLIRRMERAHQRYLLQQVPANTDAAEKAEAESNHLTAALMWARVAEATQDVEALVSAARNYLRCQKLSDQAKAGQLARRAVELDPSHRKAQKVLLEFFERTGMDRSAERQRKVLARLE